MITLEEVQTLYREYKVAKAEFDKADQDQQHYDQIAQQKYEHSQTLYDKFTAANRALFALTQQEVRET